MIEIAQIEISLGTRIEKNKYLENKFNLRKGSILALTGIEKRYISKNNETAENLAINACKKIKKEKLKKISHVISVTNTPSIKFPGISNFVSSYLKLQSVQCLNLNQGCTGYVDALQLCYSIIKCSKESEILLITSDTYSKYINPHNKAIKCLFSDGASVSIIKYKKKGLNIKKIINKSINNSENNLIFLKNEIKMDGPAIVSFAIKDVLPDILKLSKQADCIISHQAGKIVIDQIKKKINKKIFFPINYKEYGNLVSTSIPLLLKQNLKKFKSMKKVLFCGFGVGLSASFILFHK